MATPTRSGRVSQPVERFSVTHLLKEVQKSSAIVERELGSGLGHRGGTRLGAGAHVRSKETAGPAQQREAAERVDKKCKYRRTSEVHGEAPVGALESIASMPRREDFNGPNASDAYHAVCFMGCTPFQGSAGSGAAQCSPSRGKTTVSRVPSTQTNLSVRRKLARQVAFA